MKAPPSVLSSTIVVSMATALAGQGAPPPAIRPPAAQAAPAPQPPHAIPLDQIGAVAGRQYSGDGLSMKGTDSGAVLRCSFQRLDGEVTRDGLWLTSTVPDKANDRFQVKAVAVGLAAVPARGDVSIEKQVVRFRRAGLVEEYSASMDGIRQDFVVTERPAGAGGLKVRLEVAGARVEPAPKGVRLVLDRCGRTIAYSRLRVTDATGRELPARMEAAPQLAVVVDDAEAAYPVRIDPTFSDANWVSMGGLPGTDDTVFSSAVDGSGNLYIGGNFSIVGDTNASFIAKWDGTRWSALGAGMNDAVYTLAVSGTNLFAGGMFTTAGGVSADYVARWNGTTWSALGSGMDDLVAVLAATGNDVYAGGLFSTAGGSTVSHVARWNGNDWSALGAGMDGPVLALAIQGGQVYAGGVFTTAGEAAANYVARWNGSTWNALGVGMDSSVQALAVSGSDVYVGGGFPMATNGNGVAVPAHNIARWNGSVWSPLGAGLDSPVYALAMSGGNVYAAGPFSMATNSGGAAVMVNHIARWNGTSWSPLGLGVSEVDGWVHSLAVSGSNVYAGGSFVTAGAGAANNIARWNGSNWSAIGLGMNGIVSALAVSGNDLFAGGSFTTAGGSDSHFVAKWNGNQWSMLGAGMDDGVTALAASGNTLYAGGYFTTAGGNAASYIARWNGSTWNAMGSGMDGPVHSLALSEGILYAGGDFMSAGSIPVNSIARWTGGSWSALGAGMNNAVFALAASGGNLYAGGTFTTAGGGPASRVARWNGNSWNALGSGLNQRVGALAVSGSNLYAGGFFTLAGGNPAHSIARWNGTAWSALGAGVEGEVSALAALGGELYAGGLFTMAGDVPANNVARWNGSSWSPLGSGINEWVSALAISGGDLYAGGWFTIAGGKVSAYMARATLPDSPPAVVDPPDALTRSTGDAASFAVLAAGTQPLSYYWSKDGIGLTNGGRVAGATAATLMLANVQLPDAGAYSVVVSNAYGSVTSVVAALTVTTNPPVQDLPGLYLTNAAVLGNGFAQFEIRTPSATAAYTLLYSFNLRSWHHWTTLSGTNQYVMQSPAPLAAIGNLFLQIAPLGQQSRSLSFDFRTGWHGPLANGVPAVTWPQAFRTWQGILEVANGTNLPAGETVFLSGPAGSGIVDLPTAFDADGSYAGSYDADLIEMPPAPPGGTWTASFSPASLVFNKPDPQPASHSVMVLPRFAITNGQLHGVSWTYRNMTTSSLLAPPPFMGRITFGLFGHDYRECGGDDSEILFREFPSPATTNFTLSPPVLWSNAMFQVQYTDLLDNTYTVNYALGNLYEVYGADALLDVDCDPANAGYSRLGGATNTMTFTGAYSYYLVRVPKHNVVKVDTVRGSNGAYFGIGYSSNVGDAFRIGGVPDALYAVVGPTPRGFYSGGFFVIDASGLSLSSITVHVVP